MQSGRGVAARVLPEWIWKRVEAHRPSLTTQAATNLINSLLDPAEKPISKTWCHVHAALRQWQAQRLALAAAQPAAQHPTPAQPAAAPSAASIDPEQGAGDPPPHAANNPDASDGPSSPAHTPTDTPAQQAGEHDTLDDRSSPGSFSIASEDVPTPHAAGHPDASGGPSSPAHTPTDTPAQQAGQHDTLDDPFADWHESFSIHSEDSEPDSVDSAERVDSVLSSGRLHVPGKYSRHWPACPCPCARPLLAVYPAPFALRRRPSTRCS
jgi:hypothetical protein